MVLPPPTPHDAPGADSASWLGRLKPALGLSKAGLLVLVDHARPELLGELVRSLLPEYPDLEVHTEVHRVLDVPHGSTLVLVPRAADADWLNLNRPVFAHRALKVILFCDTDTSIALARQAVDFFDWISHRVECPDLPPRYAVAGIRCALASRAPGLLWTGGDLEKSFAVARPRGVLRKVSAALPFARLVAEVKEHRREWIAWTEIDGELRLMHARWALAEAGRRTRSVLVEPAVKSPGWWPVHARVADVRESRARLEQTGARFPGRLASLADMEPEAIDLLHALLSQGIDGDVLEAELVKSVDPGATLGRLALRQGVFSERALARLEAPPPALRMGGAERQAHQTLRKAEWDDIQRRIEAERPLGTEDIAWWAAWMVMVPRSKRNAVNAFSRGARAGIEGMMRSRLRADQSALLARFLLEALGDLDAADYWDQRAGPSSRPDAQLILALLLREKGRYAEAEPLLRHLLDEIEEPPKSDQPPLWVVLQVLASVVERQGRYEEAESLVRQALASAKPEEDASASLASTLASALINQGKSSEAEAVLQQLVAKLDSTSDSPTVLLGGILQGLGTTLRVQGKLSEAEAVLQRALAAHEKVQGSESTAYGHTLGELAFVLFAQERGAEAEELMRRSIAILHRGLGDQHPLYGLSLRELAIILSEQGKSEEAEAVARKALAVHEGSLGKTHPWYGNTLQSLAAILVGQGRYPEAESLLREAIEIQRNAVAPNHPAILQALALLGATLAQQDKLADALVHLHRALELSITAPGPVPVESAQIRSLLARVQRMAGDSKAQETAQEAVDTLTHSLGADHPTTRKIVAQLQALLPSPDPKETND